MLNLDSPHHLCADWEDLTETMKSRVVSDQEMDRLVNPNLFP